MNKKTIMRNLPMAASKSIAEQTTISEKSRSARRALLASAATCAIMTICLGSGAARAQSAAAPSRPPRVTGTEEVVVTAQRRTERLSRVPISVTALTSAILKTRVITHEQDLAAAVPGLIVKDGQNQNQVSFTLRGETLDPFSGASPAVLTYLNEVPFTGGNSATSFYDFSSLQVLKGPQGTLFGRNATGGAVLYTSVLPKDQYGGYLTVRAGERSMREVQGAVDLPVVPGKLTIRLAGDYQGQDGYVHNEITGHTLGDVDDKSVRATIVFTPTEYIKNVTVVEYSNFGGTEANGELYSYNKLGQTNNGFPLTSTLDTVYGEGIFPGVGNGPPGRGTFPGAVAGYLAYQKAHPYDVYLSYDLPHAANNTFLSNTTTVNLSEDVAFKNIFGYQSSYARTPGILSGTPFASLDLYNTSGVAAGPPGGEVFRNSSISEEPQITGTTLNGHLKYIVGGFYNTADKEELIPVIVGGELPAPLGQVLYHTHGTDESEAVYSQATYDFSDLLRGFSFTAGGRYTWETVGETPYADDVFAPNFPHEKKTLRAPSWNLTAQWQFAPTSQVYFTQRGSFRAGNYNGAVVPYGYANSFENEYTHDFEVGYKYAGVLAEHRLHFNIAAYDQLVTNAQHAIYAVVAGAPSAFTVNVPKATIKGFEADGDIDATPWLTVGFAGAYTNAVYTAGLVNLSAQTGVAGYVIPFDSYPDAPRWSGSLFADVKLPVPERYGPMDLRVDTFTQTSSFFSNNNGSITPGTRLPGYTSVTLRYGWNNIMQSRYSFAIYAKNLLDRVYYEAGYTEGASGGFNTVIPAEPRTIGAELTATF